MLERDETDLLLDAALRSYADPELKDGLASRVLSSPQAARPAWDLRRPARRIGWWVWSFPALAGACVLILLLGRNWPDERPASRPIEARHFAPVEPPTAPHAGVQVAVEHPRHPVYRMKVRSGGAPGVRASLPKRDVFPTPTPLSPEERVLVEVATRTPAPRLKAVVEAQEALSRSFAIADASPPGSPDSGTHER